MYFFNVREVFLEKFKGFFYSVYNIFSTIGLLRSVCDQIQSLEHYLRQNLRREWRLRKINCCRKALFQVTCKTRRFCIAFYESYPSILIGPADGQVSHTAWENAFPLDKTHVPEVIRQWWERKTHDNNVVFNSCPFMRNFSYERTNVSGILVPYINTVQLLLIA